MVEIRLEAAENETVDRERLKTGGGWWLGRQAAQGKRSRWEKGYRERGWSWEEERLFLCQILERKKKGGGF